MRLEHLQPGLHGEQQAVLNLQLGQLLVPLLQLLGEGRVAAAHKVLDQLHGPSRQDAVCCRGEAKAEACSHDSFNQFPCIAMLFCDAFSDNAWISIR